MHLNISDFGPVYKGDITLAPLTVFVGPNNSGKSYISTLIHSFYNTITPQQGKYLYKFLENKDFSSFLALSIAGGLSDTITSEVEDKLQKVISEEVKKLSTRGKVRFDKNTSNEILCLIANDIWLRNMNRNVRRYFQTNISELIRVQSSAFEIFFEVGEDKLHTRSFRNQLKLSNCHFPEVNFTVKKKNNNYELGLNSSKIKLSSRSPSYNKNKEDLADFLSFGILGIFFRTFAHLAEKTCYYLPAARSGMLQVHKMISSEIIISSTFSSEEEKSRTKLSGIVSDFLASLIKIPEEKGPLFDIATSFEKLILGGEILLGPKNRKHLLYDFEYSFQHKNISLNRASSTISELAPIFLYLKYLLSPNDLLIIEEPEAHLHPRNQRLLAGLLVKLIRSGLQLIITTHSEYLLEQLNNYLLIGEIAKKDNASFIKDRDNENLYLKMDEMSVFLFDKDQRAEGYNIKEIPKTKDEGITYEGFEAINEAIYEEALDLRRTLLKY